MSEPPIAVTIVEYDWDDEKHAPEERIVAQAVFDGLQEALDAVEVLMRFWSFDSEQDPKRRIEIQRA